MKSTGIRWGVLFVMAIGACGGRVVENERDGEPGGAAGAEVPNPRGSAGTGGVQSVGGTGGMSGTGGSLATGGASVTGAAGGSTGIDASAGTGGTDSAGAGGGTTPSLLTVCQDYFAATAPVQTQACFDCLEEASLGPCQSLQLATADETGICGSANHCALHDCPEQYIPIDIGICECVADCMASAPAECVHLWVESLECMHSACAAMCP